MRDILLEVDAKCFDANGKSVVKSTLIHERRIAIYLNGKKLLSVIALPRQSDAHVVGFLISEGVIESLSDIISIHVSMSGEIVDIRANIIKENLKNLFHEKTLTSGCCVGITGNDGSMVGCFLDSKFSLHASFIHAKMAEFEQNCELFHLTGCVHKAMLVYKENDLLKTLSCEDIGRHNAIDKVLGLAFLKGLDTTQAALIVSGRLSQEMVVKAAMSKICIVISRAASTYLGVKTADELGITLIGFAREGRLLAYTHPFRIK